MEEHFETIIAKKLSPVMMILLFSETPLSKVAAKGKGPTSVQPSCPSVNISVDDNLELPSYPPVIKYTCAK